MLISELLTRKGSRVATVAPEATVGEVIAELANNGVGALVVSADGHRVDGIVSERDVVRALHRLGAGILAEPVRLIMSATVKTASPEDSIDALAGVMTEHRIRHVPVVREDRLVGIVSIGDVVKTRIDALEEDRKALEQYITAR